MNILTAKPFEATISADGDGLGRADVSTVSRICVENPDVKFLVTFLSRENQHELCVVARKFNNLMPFGCWWFLNNSSIIAEITRERFRAFRYGFYPAAFGRARSRPARLQMETFAPFSCRRTFRFL